METRTGTQGTQGLLCYNAERVVCDATDFSRGVCNLRRHRINTGFETNFILDGQCESGALAYLAS
jgi:hypothetical protein